MFDAYAKQALQVLWVISERDQQLLAARGLKLPPHVHVTTFAPQNSVLGHPNTIAFVTQGGTNSVQEVRQARPCWPHCNQPPCIEGTLGEMHTAHPC